jgi:hypothetical protein
VRLEQAPQRQDALGRTHHRAAPAALAAGPLGEGAHGVGTGLDGDQVGARVADGLEAAAVAVAPHLRAQARLGQARLLDAGGDEHVRDRVAVEQRQDLVEVAAVEHAAHRGRPQHNRPRTRAS